MNWAKIAKRILLFGAAVVILVVGAAYIVIHTTAFNRFVLEKVVEQAQEATGSQVEIRSMQIHWDHLGVDLYGVVIHGSGPQTGPPFLTADHIGVGLKIISILRKKVDLRELIIDNPSLDLRINARGDSNLPKPASSKPSTNPVDTLFTLAIGHLVVNSGTIRYNDQRVPLAVDLRDLHSDISYGLLSGTYKGSLNYDQGTLLLQAYSSIQHSAQLNFTASRTEFDVEPLSLTSGQTRLSAHLKLKNYENPYIEGTYEGTVSTPEIALILKNSSLPAGRVALNGSLKYQYAPDQTFLSSTTVTGQVSSDQLGIQVGRASTNVRAVKGSFVLEKGNLQIPGLEADLLQGHLKAQGDMRDLAGKPSTRLTANVKNVSLEAVNNALPRSSYDRLHFVGTANLDVQASWPSSINDIVAHTRVTISSPQKRANPRTIPLSGLLDVRYDGTHDTIAFAQSHLQTGSTQVSLTGTVSKQSNLSVQANTADLREITALVSELQAATATGTSTPSPTSRSSRLSALFRPSFWRCQKSAASGNADGKQR